MALKVFVDTAQTRLRFERLPVETLDSLDVAAKELVDQLRARAQSLASGEVLQVRSGKYVSAIKGSERRTKTGVSGRVYSRDPRADLFEYGGKTGPHEIEADNARALMFQVGGGQVFAASVQHPGGDYGRESLGKGSRGKYSVIFTAYDAMRGQIFTRLHDAATGAIGE